MSWREITGQSLLVLGILYRFYLYTLNKYIHSQQGQPPIYIMLKDLEGFKNLGAGAFSIENSKQAQEWNF